MIITPDERDSDKWHILETVGEQKEKFKGVSFFVHEKCLLSELLAGKVSTINEMKISTDPYQRRLYENEPENLELRSLFAIMPPVQNHSYPIAIMLESRNSKAVSRIDETILNGLAACAALKLSDIQSKDDSIQKKGRDFTGIDANGLGELLNHYKVEFNHLRNSNYCLGILFLKCEPAKEESKAQDFEKFLSVLKKVKKAWNGQHLTMLGSSECIFSIKGDFKEEVFNITSRQIIVNIENMLAEDSLQVKSHAVWLDKNKLNETEQRMGYNYMTLFTIFVTNKFKEMLEAGK
jgi:hypothetical protein